MDIICMTSIGCVWHISIGSTELGMKKIKLFSKISIEINHNIYFWIISDTSAELCLSIIELPFKSSSGDGNTIWGCCGILMRDKSEPTNVLWATRLWFTLCFIFSLNSSHLDGLLLEKDDMSFKLSLNFLFI